LASKASSTVSAWARFFPVEATLGGLSVESRSGGNRAVTEFSIVSSQSLHERLTVQLVVLTQMMGFPRWFKYIVIATLNTSCRIPGKFNRDQVLKEPSEMCCAKFAKQRGFLKWMFLSNSG
jgi:hypothetical protein